MSFVFVAVSSPSPCLTHREARAVGPDVAVVARNHGVLYNFCGDELVINVALPGHGEMVTVVWAGLITLEMWS